MNFVLLPVLYTVLQLFLFVALGVVVRKFGSWSDEFFSSLSRLVVRLVIPIYLFSRISRTDIGDFSSTWIFFTASAVITGCGFLLGALFFSQRHGERRQRRAGIAFSAFGNSGYFSISLTEIIPFSFPLLAEAVGATTPFLYIGSYLLIHSVILWSVGNFLISGTGEQIRFQEFFSPPVIGILAGFLVAALKPGSLIDDRNLPFFQLYSVMDTIAALALPLVLISLGSMIAGLRRGLGKRLKAGKLVFKVSITRFLIFPALFYLFYFLLGRSYGLTETQLWVLFLMTHTPPALNLSVMAAQAGINRELTSYTFMITYSLYILVLPLYLILFFSLPGLF